MQAELVREARLALWDRILRGEEPPSEELSYLKKAACDLSDEDKLSVVLLFAAAEIASRGGPSQRHLIAALRYWFSQAGSAAAREHLDLEEISQGGLPECLGTHLRWPEAAQTIGISPNNYMALKRITESLRQECVRQWEKLFGGPVPLALLRGEQDE
ncbi:MAG: hypothetical protein DRI26_03550 [Chloroflexi bacterium]|nr:MAG: hypothetical protein DRI26_03550 [Chloroflexota bacterium]